jgi:hypothetical protein
MKQEREKELFTSIHVYGVALQACAETSIEAMRKEIRATIAAIESDAVHNFVEWYDAQPGEACYTIGAGMLQKYEEQK